MKRILLVLLLLVAVLPAAAQLYHAGERLIYRVSYKAKMFPNTEVGSVEVTTEAATYDGRPHYKVRGVARTLPTYRWFFNLEDTYIVHVDSATLRPTCFVSDLHEGSSYTFESRYDYDWADSVARTRWSSRKRPERQKTIALTAESMDAISLFFRMRTAEADSFREGEPAVLQMVLQDTVRPISYRFLGRETKKIRNMGRFRTLKFDCQLGTSEGFSFQDGTVFTIWISDDENKIPLYLESPVKVGSIQAYISGCEGLKYPMDSRQR